MKQFFKQYIPYYKDYIRKFIYALIGMVLVAVGTSGTAYVIKPVLDEIFIAKDLYMLKLLPFAVIALYAAKGFGQYVQSYYISYIGQDIIRRIRDKLLFHILKLDISFFNEKHGGELISRLTNDINRIQEAVSSQIASMIRESLTIIALIGVIIYQSPILAFYGLIALPIATLPISILSRKMKKLSHRSQEKNADITSMLGEIFNNIEIIMASSAQENELNKFKVQNKSFFDINIKAVKTNELTSPIMETIGSIAAAVVIFVGGKEVIEGNLSVGEFFSFMTALFMIYTPLKRLSKVYNSLQDAIAANERINDLLKLETNIPSGDDKVFDIKDIEFKNISLKYDDTVALNDINLKVSKGKKIALVGDSGGGKSSLINLIVRFYDPFEGEILFNQKNIKDFELNDLRNNISIVTQRVYIFNDTVASNIAYGKEIDRERVIECLKLAHAWDFVEKLENGIDSVLDEFGANLSGGQRQRIAIARALYKKPQILIFDEATSALDNESESEISKAIEEISKNRITFLIAHRLSTIKNADSIAVFKDGRIICQDREENLLKNCNEYRRLYNLANL